MADSPQKPVVIYLSYAPEDRLLAGELSKHLALLDDGETIRVFYQELPEFGKDVAATHARILAHANLIVPLLSSSFFAHKAAQTFEPPLAARPSALLIPILVRPVSYGFTPLSKLTTLPRNGIAVTQWENRDAAWAEVAAGLHEAIGQLRRTSSGEGRITAEPREPTPPYGVPLLIRDIFRYNGLPEVTYVEPSQLPRLKDYLDNLGPGLVVEGPSGVGKTTVVRHALPAGAPLLWIQGGEEAEQQRLEQLLQEGFTGHLVVDDFHRLPTGLQHRLAVRIKTVADSRRDTKITVIGINPVGVSLVAGLPDLAGRFQIIALGRQPDEKIRELIERGAAAANIRFTRQPEFVIAAAGSFFTAQRLCYEATVRSNVRVAQEHETAIDLSPRELMEPILGELRHKYHDPLMLLSSCDRARQPWGGGLALLWLLNRAQTRQGHSSIQAAIGRYPHLADSLSWLRDTALEACFTANPALRSLFFFNPRAGTLSLEDPQLEVYLRHLPWPEFIEEIGHPTAYIDRGTDWLAFYHATDSTALPQPPRRRSPIRILHLSDLHFGTPDQAYRWYGQLAEDLREQGGAQLDAVVLSGDIASLATAAEYEAATLFLHQFMGETGLRPSQLVLVPGNHDLNWTRSQEAYRLHKRGQYSGPLPEGGYILHGDEVIEVRDEAAYRERFRLFSAFYESVKGTPYPLDYLDQGVLYDFPEQDLVILGLNSAWQIDHHFRDRASIHPGAITQALTRLRQSTAERALKLAVFHHPLSSASEDRIHDTGFLEQLAKAGFRLALHGHIHKADRGLFRYDATVSGRRIHLVSAGTFGAPVRQWVPGYPLQYNLLKLEGDQLTVETRCREEVDGAWRPDARWQQGPGQDPLPRYTEQL